MKFLPHLSAVLFALTIPMNAQNYGVSGSVKDTEGQGIAFASVYLLDVTDSTMVKGVSADEEGKFNIPTVPPSLYFIKASYLGKSLITGTPNPAHVVSTIFEMSISDPTTYAAAFTTFRNAILAKSGGKMSMDLHQFLSGNEPGATHVVVVSTASVSDMLDMTDLIYSSSDFATYAAKVKDIRKVLRTFTMVTAKMYNMPEGM